MSNGELIRKSTIENRQSKILMACHGEVRSAYHLPVFALLAAAHSATPWPSSFFAALRTKTGGRAWSRTRDLVLIRDAL